MPLRLYPCPTCHRHIKTQEDGCPFCASACGVIRHAVVSAAFQAVVLLGGCAEPARPTKSDPPSPESAVSGPEAKTPPASASTQAASAALIQATSAPLSQEAPASTPPKEEEGAGSGLGSRNAPNGPEITEGRAEVIYGAPNPEIIRRVIRKNMGPIEVCYESALVKNPALEGKVVVYFVISPNGKVASAVLKTSLDPEVDACIVKEFQKLVFPAPPGGGIQKITYPLSFQSTGK